MRMQTVITSFFSGAVSLTVLLVWLTSTPRESQGGDRVNGVVPRGKWDVVSLYMDGESLLTDSSAIEERAITPHTRFSDSTVTVDDGKCSLTDKRGVVLWSCNMRRMASPSHGCELEPLDGGRTLRGLSVLDGDFWFLQIGYSASGLSEFPKAYHVHHRGTLFVALKRRGDR